VAAELGRIEPDPRGVSLHYLGDATIGQPGALNPLSRDDWSENRSCNRPGWCQTQREASFPAEVWRCRAIWLISAPWTLGYAHTRAMHVSIGAGIIVGYLAGLRLWLAHYRLPSDKNTL
jgi:hypothetical protein